MTISGDITLIPTIFQSDLKESLEFLGAFYRVRECSIRYRCLIRKDAVPRHGREAMVVRCSNWRCFFLFVFWRKADLWSFQSIGFFLVFDGTEFSDSVILS